VFPGAPVRFLGSAILPFHIHLLPMKKSKLLRLLSGLQPGEWKYLLRFAQSPLLRPKPEWVELLQLLRNHYPEFPEEAVERRRVYAQLFPGKPYDEKHVGYLMSDLVKVVARFLLWQKVEGEAFWKDYHYLAALLDRKLYKDFLQELQRVSGELNAAPVRDEQSYLKNYLLANLEERHFTARQTRGKNEPLQKAADALDLFFTAAKLRIGSIVLNDRKSMAVDYRLELLEAALLRAEHFPPDAEPTLALYGRVVRMLSEEEREEHFEAFKSFLASRFEGMNPADVRLGYHLAINHCVRKIKEGRREFAEEALQLYLQGIRNEILLEGGVLSPWIFKNVVDLALGLGQMDWIEDFIHTYSRKLPPEFRSNALHFNLATLYYVRKEYGKSIEELQKTQFTDIYYNLDARLRLMIIYYELNEEEPLLSLIASTIQFLKRNKQVTREVKESYLNFCQLLFQLLRRKPERLPALEAKIRNTRLLSGRTWLLRQVQALGAVKS